MGIILLLIVIGLFIAVLPIWPYSRRWSKKPSIAVGIFFVLLLIVVIIRSLSYIEIDREEGETTIKIEKKQKEKE
ncbi:MAG: DUF3309 family protein [Chlamydiae bacterium]|nr:DUF3309 family protein [Chlamydiota bacterium]